VVREDRDRKKSMDDVPRDGSQWKPKPECPRINEESGRSLGPVCYSESFDLFEMFFIVGNEGQVMG